MSEGQEGGLSPTETASRVRIASLPKIASFPEEHGAWEPQPQARDEDG